MLHTKSLKSNREFNKVYNAGKSYANRFLVVYVLENGTDCNRLGISVSKKTGNSVVRHRLTRLVRESYRLNETSFASGYDIVVIVRRAARGRNYFDIESALKYLMKLHKLNFSGNLEGSVNF